MGGLLRCVELKVLMGREYRVLGEGVENELCYRKTNTCENTFPSLCPPHLCSCLYSGTGWRLLSQFHLSFGLPKLALVG